MYRYLHQRRKCPENELVLILIRLYYQRYEQNNKTIIKGFNNSTRTKEYTLLVVNLF